MASLASIRALSIASTLVERKLRLSLVASITGVQQRVLRGLWREIHGVGPPNGKLPETVLSLITNNSRATEISAFLSLYLSHFGAVKSIDGERLIQAHDMALRMGVNININFAYYGLRDIRSGFIALPRCNHCHARYVYDSSGGKNTDRCPFCGSGAAKD